MLGLINGMPRTPLAPLVIPAEGIHAQPDREMYDLLDTYYRSNNLYDDQIDALVAAGYHHESIKELRNPVARAVEFHVAKIWPGDLPQALPIVTSNKRIIEPIRRVWKWSNWAMQKQLCIRFFALFGPLFIKVNEADGDDGAGRAERRVYMQTLDPRHVTEYNVNERGYLTYARLDVPQIEVDINPTTNQPERKVVYWTEIWTKDRVRIWRNTVGPGWVVPKNGIGAIKDEANPLGFVPIVWAPFRLINQRESVGVVTQALSRIDECNRMATRLHQMLFRYNKPLWALKSNANDPSGRPMPPPQLQFNKVNAPYGEDGRFTNRTEGEVQIGDDAFVGLPGMSELQALIPPIDYQSHLAALKEMQEELRNEIPELRYYDLGAKSNVSGVALSYILGDAVDRVLEARGMAEAALARAHQMALTIGQRAKIKGFEESAIGTYAGGDFEHSFANRPVFPLSITEQSAILKDLTGVGVPLKTALRWVGRNQEDIDQIDKDVEADHERGLKLKDKEQEKAMEAQKQQLDLQMQAAEAKAQADHERQKELAAMGAQLKDQAAAQAHERQVAAADEQQAKQLEIAKQQADDAEKRQNRQADAQAERQMAMSQVAADAAAERDVEKARKLKELDQEFAPPPQPAAPPAPKPKPKP